MNKLIRYGNHGLYVYNSHISEADKFISHFHECYEFLYITKGDMLCTVEGHDYSLSAGDLIVTAPNELHSVSFPEKTMYGRQFFHIYPEFVECAKHLLPDLSLKVGGTCNYISPSLINKYKINNIFDNIRECCEYPTEEIDAMMFSYAIQMLTTYGKILRLENLSDEKNIENKNVRLITDYIEKNFVNNINLDDISKYMYMDKSYIGRLFKQETGMTLNMYINMKRTVFAKKLILDGRQVTDIFTECGFENYSTFYRSFKKYVGISPESFKRGVEA